MSGPVERTMELAEAYADARAKCTVTMRVDDCLALDRARANLEEEVRRLHVIHAAARVVVSDYLLRRRPTITPGQPRDQVMVMAVAPLDVLLASIAVSEGDTT